MTSQHKRNIVSGEHPKVSYYSVLIGIDTYEDAPLKGCARDIRAIQEYFRNWHSSVHTEILVASHQENDSKPGEARPTCVNVATALGRVCDLAIQGDCVYVHFSGHGTRLEFSSQHGNASTGDLALVLLAEGTGNNIQYFSGFDLATLLKSMVKKGVLVTLILDCCFSGSVVRDDGNYGTPRFLKFSSEVASRSSLATKRDIDSNVGSAFRDTSMLPNWILDPSGYTILTACGPHEKAYELTFDDGKKNGALSYLLRHTLSKTGQRTIKQQHLYSQLCAKFREKMARQNPMFYGNPDCFFFGDASLISRDILLQPIIEEAHGVVRLPLGQAHGVCAGDTFELHPFFPAKKNADTVLGRAIVVRPFVSILEIQPVSTSSSVKTGWIATLLTQNPPKFSASQLADDVQCREEVIEGAGKRYSLEPSNLSSDSPLPSFRISRSSQEKHDIFNHRTNQTISIPTGGTQEETVTSLIQVLEHLEIFEKTRNLAPETANTSFDASFSVQLVDVSGKVFHSGDLVEAKEGDIMRIEVCNNSSVDVYLHILSLGSYYQIENILKGAYEVIPPRDISKGFSGAARRKVKAGLPPEFKSNGQTQCQDIIKVVLTSHPTSLQCLEMPKISDAEELEQRKKPSGRTGDSVDAAPDAENWSVFEFSVVTVPR